jgi:type VII secretion protein EccE
MKAQQRLGLTLAWPNVTAVFLIDVAVLVLASHLPDSSQPTAWWVGVAVAVVTALLGVVTYRGVTMPRALAGWVWDWSADPEAVLTAPCTPAVDHQRRFGRNAVGVREYQGRLIAVIAVGEPDDAPRSRHERREPSSATLSVAAVAAGLRQFDVHLDGIDIVSVGIRPAASASDSADQHSTWLVLRLDPQRNFAAMAARDSVASTLAATAERLAQDLSRQHCTAWAVTGDELAEVESVALAGLQPTWSRPGWRHLKHFNGYATSFWISPQDITSETLEHLWLPDTDATVVTIRLTPEPDHRTTVSAWVRYHSDTRLPKEVWAGLNRLTGRQLPAVRASLPAPAARPPLKVPARELHDHDALAVPVHPMRQPVTSPTA